VNSNYKPFKMWLIIFGSVARPRDKTKFNKFSFCQLQRTSNTRLEIMLISILKKQSKQVKLLKLPSTILMSSFTLLLNRNVKFQVILAMREQETITIPLFILQRKMACFFSIWKGLEVVNSF
jgi:hypothetical protein